jgi:hypothetical protein
MLSVWERVRQGEKRSIPGRQVLYEIPWSSYRSYAFGEAAAVQINEWGEAKIKIATPAA